MFIRKNSFVAPYPQAKIKVPVTAIRTIPLEKSAVDCFMASLQPIHQRLADAVSVASDTALSP